MSDNCVVDVVDATDPLLCGGKASGLARLERAGFNVPPAICLTTAFYHRWLAASGIASRIVELNRDSVTRDPAARRRILREIRLRAETSTMPADLAVALNEGVADLRAGWGGGLAVRSSGVFEDHTDASHAGIHASFVVAKPDAGSIIAAVKRCWASLWTELAWTYRDRIGISHAQAAMAVVVQRFIAADCAGVAFSADPLAGDHATVVIEAGPGVGESLVSGKITPEQYRVTIEGGVPVRVHQHRGRHENTPRPSSGPRTPVLTESQALYLARLVKAVERTFGMAVDIEWVFETGVFWGVQARPITRLGARREDTPEPGTTWTRANLKEVFPDLPSPLALSYLAVSLNSMFKSYHTAQGYAVPADAQLVSVFRGRPYLNLSLMQHMTVERGGDPAIVSRLFGGAEAGRVSSVPPAHRSGTIANTVRLAREMLATFFRTPYRGRRLFRRMGREARALGSVPLDVLDDRALITHLMHFGATALHERTVRRLHEVVSAQSRAYMVLERLLAAWIGSDSETLVKRLMTGLGTLPNVRMTYRLMALGAVALSEARARAFFTAELDDDAIRGYEAALAGTQLLAGFRDFLREFGHRGRYESDAMSPRFAEDPAPLLRLIQLYVRTGSAEDPSRHAAERRLVRRSATDEVRRALREGTGRMGFAARWIVFSIVCGALQRLLALRDECRHVTTLLVAHLRRVALEIGSRATRDGLLARAHDIFFIKWEELPRVLVERDRDWRSAAFDRRRDRERDEGVEAPDLLGSDTPADGDAAETLRVEDEIVGFGVSPGMVTGSVKVLRSAESIRDLSGEIVVLPAIEPTLTPLFPVVRGMIAEMGGLLSHAAILAREYGLPAVLSVRDATRRLRDGDLVELDGATGRIRVLERAADDQRRGTAVVNGDPGYERRSARASGVVGLQSVR